MQRVVKQIQPEGKNTRSSDWYSGYWFVHESVLHCTHPRLCITFLVMFTSEWKLCEACLTSIYLVHLCDVQHISPACLFTKKYTYPMYPLYESLWNYTIGGFIFISMNLRSLTMYWTLNPPKVLISTQSEYNSFWRKNAIEHISTVLIGRIDLIY